MQAQNHRSSIAWGMIQCAFELLVDWFHFIEKKIEKYLTVFRIKKNYLVYIGTTTMDDAAE